MGNIFEKMMVPLSRGFFYACILGVLVVFVLTVFYAVKDIVPDPPWVSVGAAALFAVWLMGRRPWREPRG